MGENNICTYRSFHSNKTEILVSNGTATGIVELMITEDTVYIDGDYKVDIEKETVDEIIFRAMRPRNRLIVEISSRSSFGENIAWINRDRDLASDAVDGRYI
jgi:hypothetical protein